MSLYCRKRGAHKIMANVKVITFKLMSSLVIVVVPHL